MTRYTYHPQTFRLMRLRTENYQKPEPLTYLPRGTPLQDISYQYDLIGNILEIRDRTPGSGIQNTLFGRDRLDRLFTYDPLYRLLSATGRECDLPTPSPPWIDEPRCVDYTKTRGYTERYSYDPVGNMEVLQHQVTNSFTREFALMPNSNRVATLSTGETIYDYDYDDNGNMISETSSRHFEWDHSDRMRVYRTQINGSNPSVHAHYLYDSTGQRVKKIVRKLNGLIEVTVYIDGVFEHHKRIQGNITQENNRIHVMDNQQRIALVRVGPPINGDPFPEVKYHFSDHLGSSHIVVDNAGTLINREEYTPYGETSFGSFAKKRYRFTGKERDEESGLYYHGARYYASWLIRWVSCDPAGLSGGDNLYVYVSNNPLRYVDDTGLVENEPTPEVNSPEALTSESGASPPTNVEVVDRNDDDGKLISRTVKLNNIEYVPYDGNCIKAAEGSITGFGDLIRSNHWSKREKEAASVSEKAIPRLITFSTGVENDRTILSNPNKAAEVLDYIRTTIDSGRPVMVGVNEAGIKQRINEGVTDHFMVISGYELTNNDGKMDISTLYGIDNAQGGQRVTEAEKANAYPQFKVESDGKMVKKGDVHPQRFAVQYEYQITQARVYVSNFDNVKNLGAWYGPKNKLQKPPATRNRR